MKGERTNPNDHIQKFLASLINKVASSMVIGCYLCLVHRLHQNWHPSCVNGGIIRTHKRLFRLTLVRIEMSGLIDRIVQGPTSEISFNQVVGILRHTLLGSMQSRTPAICVRLSTAKNSEAASPASSPSSTPPATLICRVVGWCSFDV